MIFNFSLHIVAHQVKLLAIVFFSRMEGGLRGRKAENKPSATGVHRFKAQDVAKERKKDRSASTFLL